LFDETSGDIAGGLAGEEAVFGFEAKGSAPRKFFEKPGVWGSVKGKNRRPSEEGGTEREGQGEPGECMAEGLGEKGQSGDKKTDTDVEGVDAESDGGAEQEARMAAGGQQSERECESERTESTGQAGPAKNDFAEPSRKAGEIVMPEEGTILLIEFGIEIGIGKPIVEKGSEGIAGPEPVAEEPGEDGGKREGPDGPEAPSGQEEEERNNAGELDGKSEAGQKGGEGNPGGGLGGVPILDAIPGGKNDGGQGDIVVGADAIDANHGERKNKESGKPAGAAAGNRQQWRETEQEGQVDESGGGVAAHGIGKEEEHFEPLRKEGVEIGGHHLETMGAVIAGDKT